MTNKHSNISTKYTYTQTTTTTTTTTTQRETTKNFKTYQI